MEMNLFCFPSNYYSFITMENITMRDSATNTLFGFQGGGFHSINSASDGVYFVLNGGNNFTNGNFKLYGFNA